MNMHSWFTALLAAGLLAGCAGSAGSKSMIDVTLIAGSANQGQAGMAVFVDKGAQTSLDLTLGGVPSGVSTPLQLQVFIYPGTCSSLGDHSAYALNQDTQAFDGQAGWAMNKVVPVGLATLLASPYAIEIRTSPADGNQAIFCGDIR